MSDLLTEYEYLAPKKPVVFWLVSILYLAIIVVAIKAAIAALIGNGFEAVFAHSMTTTVLISLDFFQPLILFGFLKRSEISWSLVPLIQGMYSALFIRQLYTMKQKIALRQPGNMLT